MYTISTENKIWLEESSRRLGVRPEALLNALLRQLRTELGLIEDPTSLEDWVRRCLKVEENLLNSLEESKKTLRIAQETLKATQLYLNQIQGTQISTSPPKNVDIKQIVEENQATLL
jgi:hypothetical protein